jgi:hypothetical protein
MHYIQFEEVLDALHPVLVGVDAVHPLHPLHPLHLVFKIGLVGTSEASKTFSLSF